MAGASKAFAAAETNPAADSLVWLQEVTINKPDAENLKEDVPSGAVHSDIERPADAETVEIAGELNDRGGLDHPERAIDDEDREGQRIGKMPP